MEQQRDELESQPEPEVNGDNMDTGTSVDEIIEPQEPAQEPIQEREPEVQDVDMDDTVPVPVPAGVNYEEIDLPEGEAPLASQERDSGLNVPPPSPINGAAEDEPRDGHDMIMSDIPEKEDIVFIESETPPDASTPKKDKKKEKKEKKQKEKKEKPPKEKKEKPLKEKKEKPPKEPKAPKEPPKPKEPKPPKEKKECVCRIPWTIPSVYKSSLVKLLCGLYALVLVVLGIVFATATSLTAQERHHLYYLEIFLVYLYSGSLIILLYFQLWLLRGVKVRNSYFDTNIKISMMPDGSIQHKSPSATPTPHRAHEVVVSDDVTLENGRGAEEISLASRHSQLVLPQDGGAAHVGEGINFYLRLGALAFAFGSVTLDGLHIASYFESPDMKTCGSDIFILVYVIHLLFTFVQTFFLFKNHKLVIDRQKALVRFGMMHIMATNLCVLIVTVITETAEDYRQQDYIKNNDIGLVKSCYQEITLARSASPFLFPCTIIYSIIGAGIIYRLYQYVGVKVKQRWPSHTSLTSSVPQGATGIDCDKANKGLFLGLLVAVLTLIAIATFFVFESRISDSATAIKVFYVTEIALTVVTWCGIIWGFKRLTALKFVPTCFFSVDSVLLIVALAGSYIYLFFILISVISGSETLSDITSILSTITIILALVQITMQIVFILDGLCRCAENDTQMYEKPGRSVVTFLLVCNLAMWVVSMFEIKKTQVLPVHEMFYGILAWNVITHMCVPLLIFFRFHSAICLSKIWYNAYQKEKQF